MNDKTRKYREQILRIATDMSDWILTETKDFPEFYKKHFSVPNAFWDCQIVNSKGIVGIISNGGYRLYIRSGIVYERSLCGRGDEDVTDSFLTNDKAGCYKDLVAGIEYIYRNWSRIKSDIQDKKRQYDNILLYNGL